MLAITVISRVDRLSRRLSTPETMNKSIRKPGRLRALPKQFFFAGQLDEILHRLPVTYTDYQSRDFDE